MEKARGGPPCSQRKITFFARPKVAPCKPLASRGAGETVAGPAAAWTPMPYTLGLTARPGYTSSRNPRARRERCLP
jgi:hypothetical protein